MSAVHQRMGSVHAQRSAVSVLTAYLYTHCMLQQVILFRHLQATTLLHRYDGMLLEARAQVDSSVSRREASVAVLTQMSVAQGKSRPLWTQR